MADIKNLMLDQIRRNSGIQTSQIAETEELIDTGLPKDEDNIQAAALAYLDEKGYRRRADNIELAKQMIIESSEGYDTVIIKKTREVETDLFEKAGLTELRDAMEICKLETISAIRKEVDRLVNRQYQYAVETIYDLKDESDRPAGLSGTDFESLEELLNRYASEGWELDRIYSEPCKNNVSGRKFVIFKKEKLM